MNEYLLAIGAIVVAFIFIAYVIENSLQREDIKKRLTKLERDFTRDKVKQAADEMTAFANSLRRNRQ